MPTFTHIIDLEKALRADKVFSLNVSDIFKPTIQQELGLVALKSFSIQYKVESFNKFYAIEGSINAVVIQESVISSKPVSTGISEQFSIVLFPTEKLLEEYLNNHPENDADRFIDDSYDVAKLGLEYLSLSLPNYPKLPGEVYNEMDNGDEPSTPESEPEKTGTISPFKSLKDRLEKKDS